MPLLHKKPFVPRGIPEGLGENDSVFFCKLTREMFTDFDDFCERIILCNSLVWSCSLTGRSNLTYQEAANSEDRTKKLLKKFPNELRIPVLYLASLCERRSLLDLTEDVFTFVKDRYFIGESVLFNTEENYEITCRVVRVIPPSQEEIDSFPKNNNDQDGERQHWPPGSIYRYEIEIEETGKRQVLKGSDLYRKKTLYNKDKNRLYIKQFVHLEDNFWKLKKIAREKYGISEVKFGNIFCGDPPVLSPKPTSPKKTKLKPKQETINKYFKPSDKKLIPQKKLSPKKGDTSKINGVKQKRRRRTKAEMAEMHKLKPSLIEAKMKAKAEKKEFKLKQAKFLREWNRKREDLECEDLRELPVPFPVNSRIPDEYFGDAILVMEFLHNFRKLIPVKDFFPAGVSLEIIERAFVDDEIAGPFSDLIQLLLVSIFDLLEQENEEIKDTDVKITPNLVLDRGTRDVQDVLRLASAAHLWIRQHHGGVSLSNLTLDTTTLTEILRLHLLSSGSKPTDKIQKWRYQARGGYCNYDDPAIQLKLSSPHIIQNLSAFSVCQLPIADKVEIINCLLNQIITYSNVRDFLEESCDKARQCRIELRALNGAEQRKEKELKKKQKEDEANPSGVAINMEDDEQQRVLRGKITDTRVREGLVEEMSKAAAAGQLSPLGQDRAFRKFWIFSSLPGLYVEHFEPERGPCLPKGTPIWNGSDCSEDALESIKHLFETKGPNKENMSRLLSYPYSVNHSSPSKKLLTENNGADGLYQSRAGNSIVKSEGSRLLCWGDMRICPVHSSTAFRQRWSYFSDPSQVDGLIENLNRRGVREKHLRQSLIMSKKSIIDRFSQVPHDRLNPSEPECNGEVKPKPVSKVTRMYENANMSFPPGSPHDLILESLLRDLILETEKKISAGCLGNLKVKSRDVWRDTIEANGYDKQCKKLTWGGKFNKLNSEIVKKEEMSEDEDDSTKDDESRSSTPTLDFNLPGTDLADDETKNKPVVSDLASAILQIEQSIEQKYLKRPLGLDQKEKDKGELRMPTPAMERWENALMQSTSLSQLFLHFSTLDNSIMWARSALNAYCRICRRKNDPENMLLCDTCDKGHHLYCLKPKLVKIPSGDWHCPTCKPKVVKVSSPVKKKRKLFSDESDLSDEDEEEEDVGEECKVCKERGSELECGTCTNAYHLSCVNPPVRKVPKSKWFCHECRQANSILQQQQMAARKDKSSRPPSPELDERVGECAEWSPARKSAGRPESPGQHQSPAVSSPGDCNSERTSRRKSSKAASQRIHKFAKQLRGSASWEANGDEDDFGEEEERPSRQPSRRRGPRRGLEGCQSNLPLDNAALQEILDVLMHDREAWPFLRPVTKSEVPDYHLVIKKPMDFGTIKHKLNMLEYTRNGELIADAELLFQNCFEYNEEGSEVYSAGQKLQSLFRKMCEESNLSMDYDEPFPKSKRPKII